MKNYLNPGKLNIFTKRCTRCELLFVSSSRGGKVCSGCSKARGSGALTAGLSEKKLKLKIKKIIAEKRAVAKQERCL